MSSPTLPSPDAQAAALPTSLGVEAAGAVEPRVPTYGQILKSTSLIGGSSAVTVLFSVVRTKAMALLLGPSGVGLILLYTTIADLAHGVASVGIQHSGVRQIAAAVGSGEPARIARTFAVLKWLSVVLAIAGATAVALLSRQISMVTFGDEAHGSAIALLALVVGLRIVASGRAALIQGMRGISDLAKMNVIAALAGTLSSIPLVYVLGERGIVPSLIAVAAVTFLAGWWYSARMRVETPTLALGDASREAGALLHLGLAFVASNFLMLGAAYLVQIIVLRHDGVAAAGLYQAGWAIGYLYVGFILQAMGADFFPRLTGCADDDVECNRLVNEQTYIGLLLAAPGVIATLTFAPLVIAVFYSAEFAPAVELLRWICLGMTLRVIVWPIGFIVLAKGAKGIFVATEAAAAFFHVGLAWLFVDRFGLAGAGAAFCGLYIGHGAIIYAIVSRMTGFTWSPANRRLIVAFVLAMAAVFGAFYLLPFWLAITIGLAGIVSSTVFAVRHLVRLVPIDHIPQPMSTWLLRLGAGGAN